jgi:hypothetical protein
MRGGRERYPTRNDRHVDYLEYEPDDDDTVWLGDDEAWRMSESENDLYRRSRSPGPSRGSKSDRNRRPTIARSYPSPRREFEDTALATEMATQKSAERSARGPMSVREKQWRLAELGYQGELVRPLLCLSRRLLGQSANKKAILAGRSSFPRKALWTGS